MAEWISAIATSIGALGVFLVVFQIRADHERSRRERAMDMMKMWANDLHIVAPKLNLAKELIESLDETQSLALVRSQEVTFEASYANLLAAYFSDIEQNFNIENGKIILEPALALLLRKEVILALNVLECVATAWRHNVADREIIEEEFFPAIIPPGRKQAFSTFRTVSGAYPSLNLLEEKIKKCAQSHKYKSKIA